MKSALFVDFDNVFSQLRQLQPDAAERFARHPSAWIAWLIDTLAMPEPHEGAAEDRARGREAGGQADACVDHRRKVPVVLGLRPLKNHLQLGGHQVVERRDLRDTIVGESRLADSTESDRAEE